MAFARRKIGRDVLLTAAWRLAIRLCATINRAGFTLGHAVRLRGRQIR